MARDDDTARAWLTAAAASGSAMARTGLAISYVRGDDEELQEEGVAWLRLAASQGFAHAQYDLAMVLLEGRGVERSRTDAIRWLRAAADQGLTEAIGRLEILGE